MNPELRLEEPACRHYERFLAMLEDYERAGETRYEYLDIATKADFKAYVRRLREVAKGIGLKPGWVPQTSYWLIETGGQVRDPSLPIIGTLQLRHWLTPALEREGGHIGYAITPSRRGQGYGTRQLALGLEKARELGLDRVLVTCDTDNIASARVIQKNGGEFQDEVISDTSGKPVSRYWIDLSEQP